MGESSKSTKNNLQNYPAQWISAGTPSAVVPARPQDPRPRAYLQCHARNINQRQTKRHGLRLNAGLCPAISLKVSESSEACGCNARKLSQTRNAAIKTVLPWTEQLTDKSELSDVHRLGGFLSYLLLPAGFKSVLELATSSETARIFARADKQTTPTGSLQSLVGRLIQGQHIGTSTRGMSSVMGTL